jgi:hypothetical protein
VVERRELGRGGAALRVVDETGFGFGWTGDDKLKRVAHALVADGGVWVVDAIDGPGVDERVRALGDVRGVIQLLDRHGRDCEAFARRFDVPLYVVPDSPTVGPFEIVRVRRMPGWLEVALWWEERRVLVCADALGTVAYFVAKNERLGVHPLLRLWPPKRLGRYAPEHVLVGHGEGVHDGAREALHEALRTSRRRLPAALAGAFRSR